jgi:tRNA 2-selenouridine synthase
MDSFLKAAGVIVDVRSPGEFAQGHIPGAYNLPLFSDEERALVGTTYKRSGKKEAVHLGLSLVGPKLSSFVSNAEVLSQGKPLKIHCWRGGMRSSSMAWLLQTAGFQTSTLAGGYKSFRRWALSLFTQPYRLCVIGGLTGSGKTALLQELSLKNEQVLDLEALAHHRGSAYGMLGQPKQPTTEQFENHLALKLSSIDLSSPLWCEDESRMIGTCNIPDPLFVQMRQSPLYVVERSKEERIQHLLKTYGGIPKEELIQATLKIVKRLGGARAQEIISCIQNNQLDNAIDLVLTYYDATYAYGLKSRKGEIFTYSH